MLIATITENKAHDLADHDHAHFGHALKCAMRQQAVEARHALHASPDSRSKPGCQATDGSHKRAQ